MLGFPEKWTNPARRVLARHTLPMAQWVPGSQLINPTTVINRSGTYIRAWELHKGVPWETASPSEVQTPHETYCNLLNGMALSGWRVYRYRVQRLVYSGLTPIEGSGYPAKLDAALAERTKRRPYLVCQHFLVLEHVPRRLTGNAGLLSKMDSDRRGEREIRQDEAQALQQLDERSVVVERALQGHEPRLLANFDHHGVTCSELGGFLGFLINGKWAPVRSDCGPLFLALPTVQMSEGPGIVELASANSRRYAAMLDIKDYVNAQPGVLNGLLLQREEFVEVQCWAPMSRTEGVESLQRQHNYLLATEDVSDTQRAKLKQGMDAVQDGRETQGSYAYSLAVFGNTVEAALESAASVIGSVAQDARGLQMAKVELLADDAWKLLSPGNFGPNGVQPRTAELTNRAFAALSAIHGVEAGKRWGNPWGEAVVKLRTASGRSFDASLHASPPKQDVEGERLAGNVLLTGMTGAGKSVAQNVILACMDRFDPRPRMAWLDYNRANEAFLRRMDGRYFTFQPGELTGLNPFRRPRLGYPSGAHLQQWKEIIQQCIWNPDLPLLPDEDDDLAEALAAVAEMQPHLRGIRRVRENLKVRSRQDNRPSIYERLGRWCRGGEYGWVLDGDDRLPEPEEAEIIGCDYTAFLDRPELCRPLALGVLQYYRSMLDAGRRIIFGSDEEWKALTNEHMAAFFRDLQKTVRHGDGLVIQTTQEVEDAMESTYGRTNISQVATFISLADEKASRECFVERMGYSEEELHIVRTLRQDGVRRCLFKQPSIGVSVVLELPDLSGMDDHLAILSGAKENLPLLDAARAEAGDDPEAWEPLFLAAVRARRARTALRKGAGATFERVSQ